MMQENDPETHKPLPSLETLKKEIQQARGEPDTEQNNAGESADLGMMWRLSADLIAGLAGGGIAGYFLDRWQGTFPLWFLICFLLGAIGGFVNMVRTASGGRRRKE